jgi:hypothetical protein
MGTIIIEPKDAVEFQLLTSMLKKMKIKMKLNLTDEEKEDLGMAILMSEVDWTDSISGKEMIEKLKNRRSAAVAA